LLSRQERGFIINNITIENPITPEKKADALDFILSSAFKSGFGTLSKSELDLIIFTAIIKYGNQAQTSDYQLSKYLQITQQRIRNLKEKASVKYLPIDIEEAIETFIEKLSYAKKDDKYIDIPIHDVAVKNAIEGLLDERNILLHSQLNSKIFRIRIDDLLDIVLLFESIKSQEDKTIASLQQEIIGNLKSQEGQLLGIERQIESSEAPNIMQSLKRELLKNGAAIGVEALFSLVPGGAVAGKILRILLGGM